MIQMTSGDFDPCAIESLFATICSAENLIATIKILVASYFKRITFFPTDPKEDEY